MPVYVYECGKCKRETEEYRTVETRHNGPKCCRARMGIIYKPAYVQPDIGGYESQATGKWIEGRKARRDDLARSGCRPWEGVDAERKEAQRQKQYADQKFDKRLDEAVRRSYHQLPPQKRRMLEE